MPKAYCREKAREDAQKLLEDTLFRRAYNQQTLENVTNHIFKIVKREA